MSESDFIDLRKIDLDDTYLSEKELIKKLSSSKKTGKIENSLFSNLIRRPIGEDEYAKYKGFYFAFEILRQELGFNKNGKPGDFDILIIPHSDSEIFFNRTCVIEVKIVRPRRINPRKAPTSYGTKQIDGLIKDGFPLIGLIHICMPEPLQDDEKATIKFCLTPIGDDYNYKGEDFLKNTVDVKFDHFSQFATVNQMKKLISNDIPKYIGLNTVGVNIHKDGSLIVYFNNDFNNGFSSGYFNPHKRPETVEKVKLYFENNSDKFKDVKK